MKGKHIHQWQLIKSQLGTFSAEYSYQCHCGDKLFTMYPKKMTDLISVGSQLFPVDDKPSNDMKLCLQLED